MAFRLFSSRTPAEAADTSTTPGTKGGALRQRILLLSVLLIVSILGLVGLVASASYTAASTRERLAVADQARDALSDLGRTLPRALQADAEAVKALEGQRRRLEEALRTLSAEMRQESLTRFEERAARLPVLLTMPMIVFILPCVFMVVGGPAVVQVLHVMRH